MIEWVTLAYPKNNDSLNNRIKKNYGAYDDDDDNDDDNNDDNNDDVLVTMMKMFTMWG